MKILVINAGSSSLKYQLINMENEHVIAKGNCERIGIAGGAEKLAAIRAALRGGYVNVLITDLDTATALLDET